MKSIIAPFVRKVLAIHPDDHVSNQEMLATVSALFFILLFSVLLGNSLLVHGL